jgi:hypothetical protein
MNGNQLMLTHYCSAGNQPHMVLDKQSTADRLVFLFAGGTNLRPEKDDHVHNVRFKMINDYAVESEWDGFKDGKKTGTTKFILSRKK